LHEAGTTTLTGGLLLQLEKPTEQGNWCFICGSVGDSKAYLWSQKSNNIIDITAGNRNNLTDASDPGGRLGPYVDDGPDFRNLKLFTQYCTKGDIIFVVSDGIHDNFDPQQLGNSPRELGLSVDTWKEAEQQYPKQTEEAKNNFRNKLLKQVLAKQKRSITPSVVTNSLLAYCEETTRNSREFMQNFPSKKQPSDYKQYPGKMDHTTCIAFVIGEGK